MTTFDDPTKPEFGSWQSYDRFAKHIRHHRRFFWNEDTHAFLNTVVATLKGRDVKIPAGTLLYRAQLGVSYEPVTDDNGTEIGENIVGHGPKRMKPLLNIAQEGRANPAGKPFLYRRLYT